MGGNVARVMEFHRRIKRYELGMVSLKDMGEELVNVEKKSAWLDRSQRRYLETGRSMGIG